MHIAICDDDRAAVELISSFVTDWASAREIQDVNCTKIIKFLIKFLYILHKTRTFGIMNCSYFVHNLLTKSLQIVHIFKYRSLQAAASGARKMGRLAAH